MPKKIPKNSISKEDLGIFGVGLIRHAEMKTRLEKEMTEKLAPFIQTAKKAQELVERMKEASKPKTYLMVAPPRPLTRQDLEEAVAAKKPKKPSKDPIMLVFERKTSTLYVKGKPEVNVSLANAPLRKKVLSAIRPEFTTTAELAKQLETTARSIQESIRKINSETRRRLLLNQKIILGEGIAGYRLNPTYSLIKK